MPQIVLILSMIDLKVRNPFEGRREILFLASHYLPYCSPQQLAPISHNEYYEKSVHLLSNHHS